MEQQIRHHYDLQSETDALIRLHRHGLCQTEGYQTRRRNMLEYIRKNQIDLQKELSPVAFILYRKYIN